jgi:hypothetical protein
MRKGLTRRQDLSADLFGRQDEVAVEASVKVKGQRVLKKGKNWSARSSKVTRLR